MAKEKKVKTVKPPAILTITMTGEDTYDVVSGENNYTVYKSDEERYACSCPAYGLCKHLRTVLSDTTMKVGDKRTVQAATDSVHDALLMSVHKFEFQVAKRIDPEKFWIHSMSEPERQAAVGNIAGAKEYGLLKSYSRLPEAAKAIVVEMVRRANEGRKKS